MKTSPISLTNFNITVLLIVSVLFFLSSCYTARIYAPQKQNIPGFEKKHDFRISASYAYASDPEKDAESRSMSGLDMQIAYAPSNNIGTILNYSALRNGFENDIRRIEAGAGYYKVLGPRKVFETYAGVGFGSARGKYSDGQSSVYGTQKYRSVFLQPSILINSKNFGFGIALKTSGVNFYNLEHTGISRSAPNETRDQFATLNSIEEHGMYFIAEPSITLRAGSKNVRAEFQIGKGIMNPELRRHAYRSFGSFGLYIAIPSKKKSQSCPDFQCK